MLVVGLTGGIGTGKSTIASLLEAKGAWIIDADEVAKEVVAPHSKAWKEIVRHFGKDILQKDKTIDRKKLGEVVFFNLDELEVLDRLTHPLISETIREKIERFKRKAKKEQIVVIDAPLLVEAGLLPLVDFTVVVTASEEVRIKRLKSLGFNYTQAKARIEAQAQDESRLKFADYIIENEKALDGLKKEVNKLLRKLKEKASFKEKKGRA